jgi:hypothetical protein
MKAYEYYDLSDPEVRVVLLRHYQSELQMTRNTLAGARAKQNLKGWAAALVEQEQNILTAIERLS